MQMQQEIVKHWDIELCDKYDIKVSGPRNSSWKKLSVWW